METMPVATTYPNGVKKEISHRLLGNQMVNGRGMFYYLHNSIIQLFLNKIQMTFLLSCQNIPDYPK